MGVGKKAAEPEFDPAEIFGGEFDWAGKFGLWKSRGEVGDDERKEFLEGLRPVLPKEFWKQKTAEGQRVWLEANRPNG